ncbi:MAG: pirin family protein [Ferruginibacter sp.]
MKTVYHSANTRGKANLGWLNSFHSFSFSHYYNPEKMHFGALRVLNDDTVAPGMGFGTHPHANMEIISIPLEGDLEHKDSMGNVAVIKAGDIQIMSAGTGITHSEYNKHKDAPVKFLQIWVIPNQQDIAPRYDQITLNSADRKNTLQQIVAPNASANGVRIQQEAWFHLGNLDQGIQLPYTLNKAGNGVYVFVLKGSVAVNNQTLNERDGFGVWDTAAINITANTDAEVLLIEVPMLEL